MKTFKLNKNSRNQKKKKMAIKKSFSINPTTHDMDVRVK